MPHRSQEGRRRVTIRDVAARAGVSVATVSRVLSGDYPVAASTRAKVMRVVREFDYVVNNHARSLSQTTSNLIALVVPDVLASLYAFIASGVEEQATEAGRLCVVCTTHGDPGRELSAVKLMREHHADAVILVGGVVETPEYTSRMVSYAKALDAAGSRLVLCGRPPLASAAPTIVVQYDNVGGAEAATGYLLSRGHRRVAHLAGPERQTTAEERVRGYRQALQGYGVEPDPALLSYGWMSRDSGYERTKRLLTAGTEFTAVFASNDDVAAGAIAALREAGQRVPADVSIVGFDDTPLCEDLLPRLTSVHLPHAELGRTAVRLVLDNAGSAHVTLGTHVVVRDSVRNLY
jgi:LacI family transcriptional regulator